MKKIGFLILAALLISIGIGFAVTVFNPKGDVKMYKSSLKNRENFIQIPRLPLLLSGLSPASGGVDSPSLVSMFNFS